MPADIRTRIDPERERRNRERIHRFWAEEIGRGPMDRRWRREGPGGCVIVVSLSDNIAAAWPHEMPL